MPKEMDDTYRKFAEEWLCDLEFEIESITSSESKYNATGLLTTAYIFLDNEKSKYRFNSLFPDVGGLASRSMNYNIILYLHHMGYLKEHIFNAGQAVMDKYILANSPINTYSALITTEDFETIFIFFKRGVEINPNNYLEPHIYTLLAMEGFRKSWHCQSLFDTINSMDDNKYAGRHDFQIRLNMVRAVIARLKGIDPSQFWQKSIDIYKKNKNNSYLDLPDIIGASFYLDVDWRDELIEKFIEGISVKRQRTVKDMIDFKEICDLATILWENKHPCYSKLIKILNDCDFTPPDLNKTGKPSLGDMFWTELLTNISSYVAQAYAISSDYDNLDAFMDNKLQTETRESRNIVAYYSAYNKDWDVLDKKIKLWYDEYSTNKPGEKWLVGASYLTQNIFYSNFGAMEIELRYFE